MKKKDNNGLWAAVIIALIFFMVCAFFMHSCTKTIYVPTTHIRTVTETLRDTVVDVQIKHDYVQVQSRDTIVKAHTQLSDAVASWSGEKQELFLSLTQRDTLLTTRIKIKEIIVRDSSINETAAKALNDTNAQISDIEAHNKLLKKQVNNLVITCLISLVWIVVASIYSIRKMIKK